MSARLKSAPGPARWAARRRRLARALGPGALLLLGAPPAAVRSNDVEYPYRTASDILYLSGFGEPESVLMLAPGSREGAYRLVVRPRDRERETWTGLRAGLEGAEGDYGADKAHAVCDLEAVLEKLLARTRVLYHAPGASPALDAAVKKVRARLRRRGRGPREERDPRPLIHAMRLRKDDSELAAMRRAAAISARAHVRAMAAARPGLFEYQVEAVIESSFRDEGASGWAYPTIVGSGPNACILHHIENNRRMRAGELVLVDAGCEVNGYAADITRTFPVSGHFRKGQRDLYDLVLAAQQQAIASVRPGATIDTPHRAAVAVLAQGLVDLGLLPGPASEVIESGSYRRFYMHRTGHWLGLDVHDVGGREDARGRPRRLGAGMVLTVEPGLYMRPDESGVKAAYRGQGIRIEDDVLVTSDGCEILTGGVPKTAAAVERACRA